MVITDHLVIECYTTGRSACQIEMEGLRSSISSDISPVVRLKLKTAKQYRENINISLFTLNTNFAFDLVGARQARAAVQRPCNARGPQQQATVVSPPPTKK